MAARRKQQAQAEIYQKTGITGKVNLALSVNHKFVLLIAPKRFVSGRALAA